MANNTREFGKINELLDGAIVGLQNQQLLNRLGLAQIRNIQKRTRIGKDLTGKAFKAYTDDYRARKEAIQGIPANVVNLKLDETDGMLASLDHKVSNDLKSVELLFTNDRASRIAGYHNETGAGKSRVKRPFFGVNDEERAGIAELIGQEMELILQELAKDL